MAGGVGVEAEMKEEERRGRPRLSLLMKKCRYRIKIIFRVARGFDSKRR